MLIACFFHRDVSCVFCATTVCAVSADGDTAALGYTRTQCEVGQRSATITIADICIATVIATVAQGLTFLGTYGDQTVTGGIVPAGDISGVQPLLLDVRASQSLKVVVVSWKLVTQASMASWATDVDDFKTISPTITHLTQYNINA